MAPDAEPAGWGDSCGRALEHRVAALAAAGTRPRLSAGALPPPAQDTSEFGLFEFRPDVALDLDRVDAVLRAAEDEAGSVDIVVFPEAAITPADIGALEALLAAHGPWCLIAGVRDPAAEAGVLGDNWVHVGVRQHLVWRHARQDKHHRWCLDGSQISQYHLGGALSPKMRWWEAVGVSPRSLQICDMGAITLAPLLCEDLARLEPVADVVRAIGPSLVVTLLLDGPQFASRWTARYASVLADDPGSAVLTLSCFGMVRRCRPPGCTPSSVVALWKDTTRGMVEIALDDGADAVLIATNVGFRDSVTADGRRHPDPAAVVMGTLLGMALEQRLFAEVRAGRLPPEALDTAACRSTPRREEPQEKS